MEEKLGINWECQRLRPAPHAILFAFLKSNVILQDLIPVPF